MLKDRQSVYFETDQFKESARLLSHANFEVFPSESVGQEVISAFRGTGKKVSVTSSPSLPAEATLDIVEELLDSGIRAVPHIAAHTIKDRDHLRRIAGRLNEHNVNEIFVVTGDGERIGDYGSSLRVIEDLGTFEPGVKKVGIAGHPEGIKGFTREKMLDNIKRRDEAVWEMGAQLFITTQMCFDSRALVDYLISLRKNGIRVPVYVGLPMIQRAKTLYEISEKCGVGDSKEKLKEMWESEYLPHEEATEVAIEDGLRFLAGFHIYSFNRVERMKNLFDGLALV